MTSDKFRGTFEGLQLPKEVVRKIYSENAIRWYKLNIKRKIIHEPNCFCMDFSIVFISENAYMELV